MRRIDLPGDLQKAVDLSEAFAHGLGVAAILGCLLWICVPRRRQLWMVVLLTAASGLLANGLKGCWVRIRPHASKQVQVIGHSSGQTSLERVEASFWDARQRSFPSGHAATAWALAIGLGLVMPRGLAIFGILAVMASVQRIVSGAHYASDVLAGMAIAFGCAALLMSVPRFNVLMTARPIERIS